MKKVLLTGASGFLGRQLYAWMKDHGYQVQRVGRTQSEVICDLAHAVPNLQTPADWVVHAAGKAHSIPQSEAEKADFFAVNLHGTRHLCQGLEKTILPRQFVFISTVSVYGREAGEGLPETTPLAGDSPYARSKIEAEVFLQRWCAERDVPLAILRLPLVAGPQAPGNLGAMVAAIQAGRYFNIGGGKARKSIVMASDVAAILPKLEGVHGIFNLTDGEHPQFGQLAAHIARHLGKKPPRTLPAWVAWPLALAGNLLGTHFPLNTSKLRKMTSTLTFDDTNARHTFGWTPTRVLSAYIP